MSRAKMWRLLVWLLGVYLAAGLIVLGGGAYLRDAELTPARPGLVEGSVSVAGLPPLDRVLVAAADDASLVHIAMWMVVCSGIAIAAASARGRRIPGRVIAAYAGTAFAIVAVHAPLLLIGAARSPLYGPEGTFVLDHGMALHVIGLHAALLIPVLGVLEGWSRDVHYRENMR